VKPKIVIIGGGGHARVVADIIAALAFEATGYVCPEGPYDIPGLTRLGDDTVLASLRARGTTHAVVAVGDNALRKEIYRTALALTFAFPALVHPSAIVSSRVTIGDGTVVMPGAIINTGTIVGTGAIINTGASIDHDCRIGGFVHIAPGCHLAGTVTVEEGAFLGVGTSVIPQRHIGEWSIVGAGAAIVRDIEPRHVATGVPARPTRHL
jgi:sugar O-acyltransferase (sialic acid O-acetyltransferase NeuD family)